ncbi:hypothetical protein W97_00565 [Coniosporium apollinis CBS 100218]|uniref:Uncharacterized protein n=1 Tax=Coniosporium apollinis (strain CBS 100218) TaxID=1168221 RepID=R7YI65_CONA1|nr:uncharacterized protein W97_00565 [Coniosporium apollinis CBS 100218]EON61351.1 hypothetical protein W97_00565 [Coniosporium apollinis CBS 100218]
MGNLCSREGSSNFKGEPHTLDAPRPVQATPPNARATSSAAPASTGSTGSSPKIARVTGPGRTLGASSDAGQDPKEAAHRAAEARMQQNQAKGDLAKKLEAQKRQTRNQTLQAAARENRMARDADTVAESRAHN